MARKRSKVYDVITDRLVELLEQGVVPWRRPWKGSQEPTSYATGKPYTGVNTFMLGAAAAVNGYSSKYWLTRKQANQQGGYITGRGWPVVFYRVIEKKIEDEETGETKIETYPLLRYFLVWNLDQAVDVDAPADDEPAEPFDPIERCEHVLEHMPQKPPIHHAGSRAFYSPSRDTVTLPPPEDFESPEAYYKVAWHELGHATGHESRLNRPTVVDAKPFGTPDYGFEELVAECTAAFVCGDVGIEPDLENSSAYIQSWIETLKNDKTMLIKASSQAKKAAQWILGEYQPAEEPAVARA